MLPCVRLEIPQTAIVCVLELEKAFEKDVIKLAIVYRYLVPNYYVSFLKEFSSIPNYPIAKACLFGDLYRGRAGIF